MASEVGEKNPGDGDMLQPKKRKLTKEERSIVSSAAYGLMNEGI